MARLDDHGTYWNATARSPGFPALSGDVSVDVAIIGGGIVGVTTARLLKTVDEPWPSARTRVGRSDRSRLRK